MKKILSFKRVISFVFVLVILSALCAPAFAEGNSDKQYFYPTTELKLSDEQEDELNDMMEEISKDKGVDVIAAAVDFDFSSPHQLVDPNGKKSLCGSIEDFAEIVYDYADYKNDCVILVYNVYDNTACISDWGFGTKVVGDDHRSEIGSEIRPYLDSEEYYTAFKNYASAVENRIDEAKREQLIHLIIGIGVCLIIGIVIAVIVVFAIKSKYKPVRLKAEANDYLVSGSFKLHESYDRFVYSHVTRTRRSKDNDSGGSSGSSHSSGRI